MAKQFVFKKKGLKMTALRIVFDAGSRLERDGRYGTMHLMEHLICKTFKDLYPTLSKLGIGWNAYTSSEQVCVYFAGLDKYLTSELKVELFKRLTGGLKVVTKSEFESERNVVCQEYMDDVFDSDSASTMNVLRKWFGEYLAIGKIEDIQKFTHKDMKDTYEKYFRKPARIVEVGRFKTKFFEEVEFKEVENVNIKKKFGLHRSEPLVNIASDDKTPVFAVSKKLVNAREYPYLSVGLDMLAYGLESPFYLELREKLGLTYYVQSAVHSYINRGIVIFKACTGSKRAEELISKMKELIVGAKPFLTQERFETIMSNMKIGREKADAVLYSNCGRYSTISKMKFPNNLDKITYDKVVEITMKYLSQMVVLTTKD